MVHNPFAVKVGTPTRSMADSTDHKESRPILAPATLVLGRCNDDAETTANNVSSSFRLKPPILNNPFLKVDTTTAAGKKPDSSEVSTTREELDASNYPDTGQDKETASLSAGVKHEGSLRKTSLMLTKSPEVTAISHPRDNVMNSCREFPSAGNTSPSSKENVFTSFAQSNSSGASSNRTGPVVQSSGFVFGQNMNERVTNVKAFDGVANGTPELSFGCREKVFGNVSSHNYCERNISIEQFEAPKETNYDAGKQVKSLTESALEYESRQVKRTYEEVAIVTGEEDESNVLQMNCKLFTFDKVTSSWVEKGRGLLRLNDKELEDGSIQSRLVARTQGSLRVVLNTKVWPGMSVDRPNPKSVRLTALDCETMRVFLISGSTKDIDQLFGALDWRVTTLKTSEERKVIDTNVASIAVPSSVAAAASIGSASFTTCDETISSSGTSPPSPGGASAMASCSSGSSGSASNATSPLVAGDALGPKKRRISPPSALDEDDSCLGSSSADSRVQERRVDSTDNMDSNSCDDSNLSFASSSTI